MNDAQGYFRRSLQWRLCRLSWLVAAGCAATFSPAAAHTEFEDAQPSPNAVLSQPPGQIVIRFKQPVEPRFSRISLHRSSDGRAAAAASAVDPAGRRVMSLPLPAIAPGGYTVRWTAVALDGHRTAGEYHFVLR